MPATSVTQDTFTPDETRILARYFTNTDRPIFALTNLPETVKGALFARYSRSAKSLRRLFLDEFLGEAGVAGPTFDTAAVGAARADKLFARVLNEYGDDSVAQLGGAHLACEGVSNVLTKVLEWGRLMAYLEQSTRYVPYTDRPGGLWKYHVPAELTDARLREQYTRALDLAFSTYAKWIPVAEDYFRRKYPKSEQDSDGVYRSVIRAKALDTLRGLLPAATTSNVGLFGTGQAYEAMLMRMFAHPLEEVRAAAADMLVELRQVIPAFLARIDQPGRGVRSIDHLAMTRAGFLATAAPMLDRLGVAHVFDPGSANSQGVVAVPESADEVDEVTLTEFDPEGELKIVASALYSITRLPDADLIPLAQKMSADDRLTLLKAYCGDRSNRRHRPARAFERTRYRFDVLTDYGAFRDLQRHRMLTLEWQPLSTRHGYVLPAAVEEFGALADWRAVMEASAALHDALVARGREDVAPYSVVMAYRVRFYMDMNAREAMHVIELRTSPQGHPAYRRVCQQMHRLIGDVAGHRAVAAAMQFADHSQVELERLHQERAMESKRLRRQITERR